VDHHPALPVSSRSMDKSTGHRDTALAGKRILVISPHADDETFGCGGMMAKAKAFGSEVAVVVVSIASLHHYNAHFPHVTGDARREELEAAMKVIGVDDFSIVYTDEHTHMRVDAIPRRDLVAKLEREGPLAIDRYKPDILCFPAISYNQDHEAVFKAVYAACRPHAPSDKPFARMVLAYDQPQLAWNYAPFHPNLYVDISDSLDVKLRACACYKSQLRPDPHAASLENLERYARVRGSEISVTAAEAFYCHRYVV
jgi:N-acetylglucosamine malate deacetylase 1